MTHVSHEGTTSSHSSQRDQRVKPDPPYPSARLPCDTTLGAIRGWPMHYSLYTQEVW
jgi:hypothetical protein